MQEQIRELYQKLYNENIELLNEKKLKIKKEKTGNKVSVFKSIVLHKLLRIAIEIISIIFVFFFIKFIGNTVASYTEETFSSFMHYIVISAIAITVIIYAAGIIYIIKRTTRPIQKNFWVKISTTEKEEYNDVFCEKICKPIIEYVIPNIKYDHSYGISKESYEDMGFSNIHESYSSTDSIILDNNANLMMSKVHAKFKEFNGNGYWYATLFCGIASIQTLNFNTMLSIKIRNRKLESLKLKNAIPVSNEEFNNYYEIETDNSELLHKYLTNEMLTYFIELAKKNINLEVNIFENKICIRMHDKDFLEFNTDNEADVENIINSCNSIIAVINTNDFIINELKSNNIY